MDQLPQPLQPELMLAVLPLLCKNVLLRAKKPRIDPGQMDQLPQPPQYHQPVYLHSEFLPSWLKTGFGLT